MKPTTSAIETAIKNAARDAKNYSLLDTLSADGLWYVVHQSGDEARRYWVNVNTGTCTCEQFLRAGCCKHGYLVDEEIQIRAMEEAIEANDFMLSCSREHNVGFAAEVMADTAGAWY